MALIVSPLASQIASILQSQHSTKENQTSSTKKLVPNHQKRTTSSLALIALMIKLLTALNWRGIRSTQGAPASRKRQSSPTSGQQRNATHEPFVRVLFPLRLMQSTRRDPPVKTSFQNYQTLITIKRSSTTSMNLMAQFLAMSWSSAQMTSISSWKGCQILTI